MKILVTGAKGFVGKNLCSQLHNIADQKARWYRLPEPIEAIYEYDNDSTPEKLEEWCKNADFVFNLANIIPLLDTLKKYRNSCPVMISSSSLATLTIHTVGQRKQVRSSCSYTLRRSEPKFLSIVSQICSVNGATLQTLI